MKHTIYPNILRIIAFFSCLVFLLYGCGKEPETAQPKKVVAQKITVQKEIQPPQPSSPTPSPVTTAKAVPPSDRAQVSKETEPKRETSVTAQPVLAIATASKPAADAQPETVPEDGYFYNPKGKIDPFAPFFEDERTSALLSDQMRRSVPRTPLEKLDLSQLKLVGIILSESGNSAIVEESSGKGYIIDKGTYIGNNRGRVAQILKDRVIIEEIVKYGISEASILKKELKLQKPPGED